MSICLLFSGTGRMLSSSFRAMPLQTSSTVEKADAQYTQKHGEDARQEKAILKALLICQYLSRWRDGPGGVALTGCFVRLDDFLAARVRVLRRKVGVVGRFEAMLLCHGEPFPFHCNRRPLLLPFVLRWLPPRRRHVLRRVLRRVAISTLWHSRSRLLCKDPRRGEGGGSTCRALIRMRM